MSTEETFEGWKEMTQTLVRSGFAKIVAIGQLYDARAEKLGSDNLFDVDKFPKEFVGTKRTFKGEVRYSYKSQLSDRLNFLDVEPELQLNVLLEFFSLQGHLKYLNHQKPTEKTVSTSLLYHWSTVCEELIGNFSQIGSYIKKRVLKDEQYTHFVVAIDWGAKTIINLEYDNDNLNVRENDESMLKSQLHILGSMFTPKPKDDCSFGDTSNRNKIRLNFYADVNFPDGSIPNSMEKLREYSSKFPDFVQKLNDGKGVPLKYFLLPLSVLNELGNCESNISPAVKSIGDSIIIQLVYFFGEFETMKMKLNDLKKDYSLYQKYFPLEGLKKIQKIQLLVKDNEIKVKKDLADDLNKFKEGELTLRDFIKKVQKHKSSTLNLVKIENFIHKFSWIRSKIDVIDLCLSKEIVFLRNDQSVEVIMNDRPDDNFYVMYTSKKLEEKNPDLHQKTLNYYLSAAENLKDNERYIMVDLDLNLKSVADMEIATIKHFKSGLVISEDVYKDFERKDAMNFARLINSISSIPTQKKSFNRVVLQMPCPGYRVGTCSENPLTWTCNICKDYLEFGFDNFFYCGCGKASIALYEFKCSSSQHGSDYLPVGNYFSSIKKDELKTLKPPKEMNILILGQSGVGKSTWINSIVNYFQYDTLDEAEKGGVITAIPASFGLTYMKNGAYVKQTVQVGENNDNELMESGKSATQDPKTYYFTSAGRFVRLIDTPGLGDTGGIEQDKENMKKVLDHISHLEEIHGICILLKSNETRIGVLFRFCIVELLNNLSGKAARNIIFCFTKSRGSFYSPGDTSVILDQLLKELNLDDVIPLNEKTMFCLDNEAFRYLCTLKYPDIPKTEEDRKLYERSWTKSVAETKRLFEQIETLKPYSVSETTNLCKIRNRVLYTAKSMAELIYIIQLNLAFLEDIERSIKKTFPMENIYLPQIKMKREKFLYLYPQALCTSPKCIKYRRSKNFSSFMEQDVHDLCFTVTNYNVYHYSGLKNSKKIINSNSAKCLKCGCSWDEHYCTTYKKTPVEAVIVEQINQMENLKDKQDAYKWAVEKWKKKFQAEQDIIINISSQFRRFLEEDTLGPYNDNFEDYLKHLIQLEENKIERNQADDDLLRNLKQTVMNYDEKVQNLKETWTQSNELNLNVINDLMQKLNDLEWAGEQMEEIKELSIACITSARRFAEVALPVNNKRNKIFSFKIE